ncbi:MAG: hypothetical protein AAGG51_26180 [Cyanobacteria bacterium P01_G01_bin.54]
MVGFDFADIHSFSKNLATLAAAVPALNTHRSIEISSIRCTRTIQAFREQNIYTVFEFILQQDVQLKTLTVGGPCSILNRQFGFGFSYCNRCHLTSWDESVTVGLDLSRRVGDRAAAGRQG